jgi:hypothetical protein
LLLAENYNALILTIDNNAVGIYCTNDGNYTISDSHSRDIYGRSHPQGTCVLLEASSINHVILHFQSVYNEKSQYEMRGVNIGQVQTTDNQNLTDNMGNADLSSEVLTETASVDISCTCVQCCAVSLYSICYSTIKPYSYWDENTVVAVTYFGTVLYNNTGIYNSTHLPQRVELCGIDVHVKLRRNYEGVLNDKLESQLNLKRMICHSDDESTGFLLWLGSYCISCMFQTTLRKTSYSILAYKDDRSSPTAHFFKNIDSEHTLVKSIFLLAHHIIGGKIFNYEIQFLFCSCKLTVTERKRVLKSHVAPIHKG